MKMYVLVCLLLSTYVSTQQNVFNSSQHQQKLCNQQLVPDLIKQYQPPSFNEFKLKFEKKYATTEEEQQRCFIYYGNVEKIREEALQVTWKLAVNHLFDMSEDQWNKWRDLETVSNPQQNSSIQIGNEPLRVGQAASINWNTNGKVTKVKNQGSCGSCWSFATCGYGESRLVIRGNKTLDIDLAEQYLIDCSSQNSCSGGYLEVSFKKAGDDGVPLQSSEPYRQSDSGGSLFACLAFSTQRFGYIPRARYGASDQELINLLQTQPVAISISSSGWMGYNGGTFRCTSGAKVDHAVLLVGYNSNQWIIKNQWGEDWGQQGYMRITRSRSSNCGIGTSAFYMSQSNQFYRVMVYILAIFLISW